jgi:hypothetical protein
MDVELRNREKKNIGNVKVDFISFSTPRQLLSTCLQRETDKIEL